MQVRLAVAPAQRTETDETDNNALKLLSCSDEKANRCFTGSDRGRNQSERLVTHRRVQGKKLLVVKRDH